MLPSLRALPCHVCPEQTLDRLLAANARARRLGVTKEEKEAVAGLINAGRRLLTCGLEDATEESRKLRDAHSGINAADALAVQALYATAGQSGSHRIVSALRAIEAWIREGGAL